MKNKMNNVDLLRILLYDLGCLELKETGDNKYHYKLLRENIIDLFNKSTYKKYLKQEE